MKKTLLLSILIPWALSAQNFWTETFPFSGDYYVADISIVDESTVWTTGTDLSGIGTWSPWLWGRSTDGGLNWTYGFLPDDVAWPTYSKQIITNICALSDQTAYVGAVISNHSGTSNRLLVTHDAGNIWTQVHPDLFSDAYSFIRGVHFFDNDHAIAFGDPVNNNLEIYTSADAAVTWTRVDSANIPDALSGEYVWGNFDTTSGIIRILTSKGRLFSSQDRGLTWTASQTPGIPFDTYGSEFFSERYFSFKDVNEGLLVTAAGNPALYRTTDGGTTWTPAATAGILSDRTVNYVPQTAGTFYNTGKTNYDSPWSSGYSTDNGNSWTVMTDNPNFNPIVTEFLSPTVGFASGYDSSRDYHGFYRLTDTFHRLLKNKSFLENNFNVSPNPTTAVFKIKGSAIALIVIQDAAGKAIYRQTFAGTAEAEIDLSGLKTGIYFANISNDNGSKTIKIIKN